VFEQVRVQWTVQRVRELVAVAVEDLRPARQLNRVDLAGEPDVPRARVDLGV